MAAIAIAGAGAAGGGGVGSESRVGVGITLKKDQDGFYAVREVADGGSADHSGEVRINPKPQTPNPTSSTLDANQETARRRECSINPKPQNLKV
jgi:hypothetical protein